MGEADSDGIPRGGDRLFDVAVLTDTDIETLFAKPIQQLAAWRDNSDQVFLDEEQLSKAALYYGFELTPRIATIAAMPVSIQEAHDFLKETLPQTLVALDDQARVLRL